jgi:hypothetical protein
MSWLSGQDNQEWYATAEAQGRQAPWHQMMCTADWHCRPGATCWPLLHLVIPPAPLSRYSELVSLGWPPVCVYVSYLERNGKPFRGWTGCCSLDHSYRREQLARRVAPLVTKTGGGARKSSWGARRPAALSVTFHSS